MYFFIHAWVFKMIITGCFVCTDGYIVGKWEADCHQYSIAQTKLASVLWKLPNEPFPRLGARKMLLPATVCFGAFDTK